MNFSRASSNGNIWHKNVGSHPLDGELPHKANSMSSKSLEETENQKSDKNESISMNELSKEEVAASTPSSEIKTLEESTKLLDMDEQNLPETGQFFK